MAATTKGPGEFFTVETLRDVMNGQKRPRIGGMRTYGDEWDGHFIPRGWKAKQPMLNADPSEQARNIVLNAVKRGIPVEDQIAARVKERARVTGGPTTGTISMGELAALGADGSESVNIIDAVRDIHGAVMPVAPVMSVVGAYPYTTIATFMLSIGVGAMLGGFIGARGVEALLKKLGLGKVGKSVVTAK